MVFTAIFTSAFRTTEKGNVMMLMLMMTTKNKRLEMKKAAGSDS